MKQNQPKISIIIPVYNTEQYLQECLDSVLNQTFADFEVICIDDGSTDNSYLILEKYAKKDSRIKIFKNHSNIGCVATKNKAISKSQGEYIYPLDSDDIILPETLQKLYSAIQCGLGDIVSCDAAMFGARCGILELPAPTIANFAVQNCIINSALFKKSDFLQLPGGGYDSNFNEGLEDYDLWLNFVYNLKKRVYRIPECLYRYRIRTAEQGSRNLSSADKHAQLSDYCKLKYPEINAFVLQREILGFLYRYRHVNRVRLFGIVPIYKIKNNYVYLFDFIPILKLRY